MFDDPKKRVKMSYQIEVYECMCMQVCGGMGRIRINAFHECQDCEKKDSMASTLIGECWCVCVFCMCNVFSQDSCLTFVAVFYICIKGVFFLNVFCMQNLSTLTKRIGVVHEC